MIQGIKSKIKILRADPHMREVARGTVLAFTLKVIGAGLAFSYNVAVARLLGAEGAGLYFLALSIATIGSVIGRIGMDNTMLRLIATHASREEWGKVSGIYRLGMRTVIATSGLVTAIFFFTAPWMATELFNKPDLVDPLRWMSLSILPFSLLNLQAESLKGLKSIRDAMLVQSIGLPLTALVLIFPFSQLAGVSGVVWAYTAGSIVVVLLGMWSWHRVVGVRVTFIETISFGKLWVSCSPLFMASIINRAILPWAPLFILGIWASSEEVGVFGVTLRVAMLVSFMLVAINNVISPKFAELYERGDMEALGRISRQSAMMITLISSPILLVLFFEGQWVLSLFGKEFELGVEILSVLIFAQFINVLTGSVGYLLMMSGNEHFYRNATVFSALLQLVLSILLIPIYGGLGAAIAVAISIACLNLTAAWYVKCKLSIQTIPFLIWKKECKK